MAASFHVEAFRLQALFIRVDKKDAFWVCFSLLGNTFVFSLLRKKAAVGQGLARDDTQLFLWLLQER